MSASDILILILCPIGLVALLTGFTILVLKLFRNEKQLVEKGERDVEISAEFNKVRTKGSVASTVISRVIEVILLLLVAFLVFIGIYSAAFSNNFPLFGKDIKLVASNSMASVHESNEVYIEANHLENRFEYDDLIIIETLPSEDDLNLYDIVTYVDSRTGNLIIHRIINIDEQSDGTKLYTLRGDANGSSDTNPITYSDMRGIYYGSRIRGLGIIIRFVQSWFGVVGISMCIYVCVANEVYDYNMNKVDKKRFELISNNQPPKEDLKEEIAPTKQKNKKHK